MKEWYNEKKSLQQTNINLKTENSKSKTENSADQADSLSLQTIRHFGNFWSKKLCSLTLFLPGSGMTLIAEAGPLWPRIDSRHSEAVRRCPKAQN